MDQFILFGDSITQIAFSPDHGFAFGAALANAYVRKLDILNRGFSGYNTRQALRILPSLMPSPSQVRVRFMAVFFGANDARLPNTPGGPDQHVPLEEFKENVRKIVVHPCVRAHEEIKIILITPPPVDERLLAQADQAKYPDIHPMLPRRTARTTAAYAQAVRDLGLSLSFPQNYAPNTPEVALVDLWSFMLARAGQENAKPAYTLQGSMEMPANAILQSFLLDGLHLTRAGYEVLFEQLMWVIGRRWPAEVPEALGFVYPTWDDEGAWTENREEGRGDGTGGAKV